MGLRVIIYSEGLLQAFEAEALNFEIIEESPYIDVTSVYDTERRYVKGFGGRRTIAMEMGKATKAELDPTTMARIARFNLDFENKALIESAERQVREKEIEISRLDTRISKRKAQLDDIASVIERLLKSDCNSVQELLDNEDSCLDE